MQLDKLSLEVNVDGPLLTYCRRHRSRDFTAVCTSEYDMNLLCIPRPASVHFLILSFFFLFSVCVGGVDVLSLYNSIPSTLNLNAQIRR